MIIVDTSLEKLEEANKSIRVGMIGAGFMAKGLVDQIVNQTPGMKVVAISNRTIKKAEKNFSFAGIKKTVLVNEVGELDRAIKAGIPAITEDFKVLCKSKNVDVIVDMTGAVEFGANIVLECIKNKKHIVSMNVELDGTVGSILKRKAGDAGIIYSLTGGDQPGVILDLYRYVKGIGLKPVLAGNVKGLHDPYRTPSTQAAFAKKWKQQAEMVTSFADGTKISFEQAVVANATGMRVGKRGMHGPTVEVGTPVDKAWEFFPLKDLNSKEGIVDYIVGVYPPGGVFVIAKAKSQKQKHYLSYYKLGNGPFYTFYTPYHICHFEVPSSIARAVLFNDITIAPLNKPMVDVVAVAKKDIKGGEVIDGLGGYATYGLCENYKRARVENLLPIGLAQGCIAKRNIKKDQVVKFDDVILPEGRLIDLLWKEQLSSFK